MSRKCAVCAKTTYPMETTTYDGRDYHNPCFRCKSCDARLNPATTQNIGGEVYCKGCYARIFKSSGGSYAAFGEHNLPKSAPVSVRDMEAAKSASATTEPVSPKDGSSDEIKPVQKKEASPERQEETIPVNEQPAVAEKPKEAPPKSVEVDSPKEEIVKPSPIASPATTSTSSVPASGSVSVRSSGGFPVFGGANTCRVCEKKVYLTDEVKFDSQSYHKACFRCKTCNNALSLGRICNFEKDLYCSNCFKRSFREGGGQYNTIGSQ